MEKKDHGIKNGFKKRTQSLGYRESCDFSYRHLAFFLNYLSSPSFDKISPLCFPGITVSCVYGSSLAYIQDIQLLHEPKRVGNFYIFLCVSIRHFFKGTRTNNN